MPASTHPNCSHPPLLPAPSLQSLSCDADIEDLGLNAYGPGGLPPRPDAASVLGCTKGHHSSGHTPSASQSHEQEDERRALAEARAAVVQALQVFDLGPAQKLYVPHSMQQLAQVWVGGGSEHCAQYATKVSSAMSPVTECPVGYH